MWFINELFFIVSMIIKRKGKHWFYFPTQCRWRRLVREDNVSRRSLPSKSSSFIIRLKKKKMLPLIKSQSISLEQWTGVWEDDDGDKNEIIMMMRVFVGWKFLTFISIKNACHWNISENQSDKKTDSNGRDIDTMR
jgi:hypothetical protein